MNRRFRAKATLEGAVAEVQLGKKIQHLVTQGIIAKFEEHDLDGYPDYTIWLPGSPDGLRIECKNVRDSQEAYRSKGEITAYKVETQKTRTSNNDPSSRFYDKNHFEILAVCLGKKTRNWTDFLFIGTINLSEHRKYHNKLAVMHRVPLHSNITPPWHKSLEEVIKEIIK